LRGGEGERSGAWHAMAGAGKGADMGQGLGLGVALIG